MPLSFTHAEIQVLAEALGAGGPLVCPRCKVPVDQRDVPPRPDVSYVRSRLWLNCPECHRTVVLDRKEHP